MPKRQNTSFEGWVWKGEKGLQPALPLDGHCSGPLFAPPEKLKRSQATKRAKAYKAKLRQATPPWADRHKIGAIYRESRALTKATGLQYSVDHIVPLKGRLVCGLHVEYNLEVKLQKDNMQKGNYWNPEEQGELW